MPSRIRLLQLLVSTAVGGGPRHVLQIIRGLPRDEFAPVVAAPRDGPLFDLDLAYKVQTVPGGIAQVVGMAEGFAAGGKLVVCLGDNIFEYAEVGAIRQWAQGDGGALIFVKEVPDPERFGVVVYGDGGQVADVVEKAGVATVRLAVA